MKPIFAGCVAAVAVALVALSSTPADAAPVRIVVIGASNTAGFLVGAQNAFPARLETLLRATGVEAYVTAAGVVGDTTSGMLRRIDPAVPDGTHVVVLQPGGNDLRFFGTIEQRMANIATINRRLKDRGIKLIVYDPVFPSSYFTFDGIHFTAQAHSEIAAQLAPMVLTALRAPPRRGNAPTAARKPGS